MRVLVFIFTFIIYNSSAQELTYPQILPNNKAVAFSNPQVREIARVIESNTYLKDELKTYKEIVGKQDTLNMYSNFKILKLDSLVIAIDKKFGVVYREYNKVLSTNTKLESDNLSLTRVNKGLKETNKKLNRTLWVQRVFGAVALATIIAIN